MCICAYQSQIGKSIDEKANAFREYTGIGRQPPLTEAVAWASLRFSRLDTNSEKNKAPYETYKLR